eukprot:scpid95772/ scgid29783/ 
MSSESQQLVPKKEAKLGLRAKIAALRAKKASMERQREEESETKECVPKKEATLKLREKAATLVAEKASSEPCREEGDNTISSETKESLPKEESKLDLPAKAATLGAEKASSERGQEEVDVTIYIEMLEDLNLRATAAASERQREEGDRQRACIAAREPYKVQFQTNADSSTDQDRPYGALKVTKSALPLQSSLPLDPRVWWELSQHRTLEPAYLRTTREGRVRINKMKRDAAKRRQLE